MSLLVSVYCPKNIDFSIEIHAYNWHADCNLWGWLALESIEVEIVLMVLKVSLSLVLKILIFLPLTGFSQALIISPYNHCPDSATDSPLLDAIFEAAEGLKERVEASGVNPRQFERNYDFMLRQIQRIENDILELRLEKAVEPPRFSDRVLGESPPLWRRHEVLRILEEKEKALLDWKTLKEKVDSGEISPEDFARTRTDTISFYRSFSSLMPNGGSLVHAGSIVKGADDQIEFVSIRIEDDRNRIFRKSWEVVKAAEEVFLNPMMNERFSKQAVFFSKEATDELLKLRRRAFIDAFQLEDIHQEEFDQGNEREEGEPRWLKPIAATFYSALSGETRDELIRGLGPISLQASLEIYTIANAVRRQWGLDEKDFELKPVVVGDLGSFVEELLIKFRIAKLSAQFDRRMLADEGEQASFDRMFEEYIDELSALGISSDQFIAALERLSKRSQSELTPLEQAREFSQAAGRLADQVRNLGGRIPLVNFSGREGSSRSDARIVAELWNEVISIARLEADEEVDLMRAQMKAQEKIEKAQTESSALAANEARAHSGPSLDPHSVSVRSEDSFLDRIGVDPQVRLDLNRDFRKSPFTLSQEFGEPECQGYSFSCQTVSIVGNMVPLVNGLSERSAPARLDMGLAYGLALSRRHLGHLPEELLEELRRRMTLEFGIMDDAQFYQLIDQGVGFEELTDVLVQYGVPHADWRDKSLVGIKIPESVSKDLLQLDRYQLTDLAMFSTEEPGLIQQETLLRALLAGHPLVVGVSSDARYITEDWIKIDPNSPIRHALQVVGFGIEVDPFDLVEKPFFYLRDSFTPRRITYKVAADDLLQHLHLLARVTGVEYVPGEKRSQP